MSSCLLPTIQILQPSIQNPVLRPKITKEKSQPPSQTPRKLKKYPTGSTPTKLAKMRTTVLRNSAFLSILGLSSAQTPSTWAQTQPFIVDVSTESLLGSSQQPLTNIVGTNTPDTTALAPVVPVTDQFSTTIPTELSTATSQGTSTVTVTSSTPAGSAASASASSASASRSALASSSASASRSTSASASGSGAAAQSSAAAAPVGVNRQAKMMGVAGALAGAAGVLFV
jgi:hypothetical protein